MHPTVPINIPRQMMHKSASFSKSPSSSQTQSPSIHSPLQTVRISQKKVVLYGAPFKNSETISNLLKDCIDVLDTESIAKIIDEARTNNTGSVTIITCNPIKAFTYCQNLVENGLNARIE